MNFFKNFLRYRTVFSFAGFAAAIALAGCSEASRKSLPPETSSPAVPTVVMTPVSLSEDLLDRAPAVAAAKLRLQAARERLRLSGVLPDPMVTVEYMRVPVLGMDGIMVELEQPLPRWGERDAERATANATITMAVSEYAAVRGRTMSAVQTALIERRAAIESVHLERDIAQRARVLAEVLIRSGVASGKSSVREPLALETRAAAAEVMAAQDERMAADAEGMANSTLGLTLGAVLPKISTPDPSGIDPLYAPEVLIAIAREFMAAGDERMARSRSRPMVAVIGRWRQVGEEDDSSYEGGLRVSVPLWSNAYAGGISAAESTRMAAHHDRSSALFEATEMLARVRRTRAQAALTKHWAEAAVIRLDSELDVLAAESAAGKAGATIMLFDRFDQLAEARRSIITAEADADRACASLWILAPATTLPARNQP